MFFTAAEAREHSASSSATAAAVLWMRSIRAETWARKSVKISYSSATTRSLAVRTVCSKSLSSWVM